MQAVIQLKEMQTAKNIFSGFGGRCGKTNALMSVTCKDKSSKARTVSSEGKTVSWALGRGTLQMLHLTYSLPPGLLSGMSM